MNLIRYTILLCCMVFISAEACNSSETVKGKSGYQVSGKAKNFPGKVLVLEEINPRGFYPLDSATVEKDGSFKFSGSVAEPTFVVLKLGDEQNPKNIYFMVDTLSRIKLDVDVANPAAYVIEGSEDSKRVQQLMAINDKAMQRF